MDLQKITTGVTAAAVIGTGATVGGNHLIDQKTGGPQRREDAKIEAIRQVVREEVYKQLVNAWPETSGPVNVIKPPSQNYKQVIPQSGK